jgi:DNA-cytosine methyltransferase
VIRLEIFSCSGGMAEGFRRAGLGLGMAVDKDSDAVESYTRNLGHRPVQIASEDLLNMVSAGWRAPVELLVADPPCTPWSRAGKREGLADERDQLRTTVELIRALRPFCWLVANVPGLDDGPNWPVVQQTIGSLEREYAIQFRRFDAADFGVPQHRVRPFWFGRPHGSPALAWPTPTHGDPSELGHSSLGDAREPWVTCRQALGHLSPHDLGAPIRLRKASIEQHSHEIDGPARTVTANAENAILKTNKKHPVNQPDKPSYTVTAKGDCRGAQGACVLEGWPWDRPATTVQADPRIAPPGHHGASFLSAKELDRPATTVTARDEIGRPGRNGRDGSSQSTNAIKLSERAAAILQGFPEGWHFAGATKRARWSQIGQAMPPPLAEAVARTIGAWLGRVNPSESRVELTTEPGTGFEPATCALRSRRAGSVTNGKD